MSQLLVVTKEREVRISDEAIDEMIFRLLDAKRLSFGKMVLRESLRSITRVIAGAPDMLAVVDKDIRIAEALPTLRLLLKRVLEEAPERVHPNLQVLSQRSEELAQVKFSTDRHQPLVVYAAHPWRADYYIPLADFHRYLAEEKRAEFQRLCAALGAKHVRSTEQRKQASEAGGAIKAPIPSQTPVTVGAEFNSTSTVSDDYSVRFSVDEAFGKPELPDRLCWYHHEPAWQAMAENRLSRWITQWDLRLDYTRDFSVDAKLAVEVQSLGFSIGGNFSGHRSVSTLHEIEYFPRSAYPNNLASVG